MNTSRRPQTGAVRVVLAGIFVLVAACNSIPPDALKLGPDARANRDMQTRVFRARSDREVLSACAGVLQDLGYTIDESETALGVIVATKDRTAVDPLSVTFAVMHKVTTLGLGEARYIKTQAIRVSLAVQPAPGTTGSEFAVRATFQRRVADNFGQAVRIEQLNDPRLYDEFYARLSTSVFLETQAP